MRYISFRETRIIRAISTGARFIAIEGREKRGSSSFFMALKLAIHNIFSIALATRVVVGVRGGAASYGAFFLATSLHTLIVTGRGRARGLLTRSAAGTSATSSILAAVAVAST